MASKGGQGVRPRSNETVLEFGRDRGRKGRAATANSACRAQKRVWATYPRQQTRLLWFPLELEFVCWVVVGAIPAIRALPVGRGRQDGQGGVAGRGRVWI